jgi:hypothetical protein
MPNGNWCQGYAARKDSVAGVTFQGGWSGQQCTLTREHRSARTKPTSRGSLHHR